MSIILDGNAGISFNDSTSQNTSAVISGKLPTAKLPAGSVLQVVQATTSTEVSTTSTSYVSAGLSASITPTSSSNKILILVEIIADHRNQASHTGGDFTVYKIGRAHV